MDEKIIANLRNDLMEIRKELRSINNAIRCEHFKEKCDGTCNRKEDLSKEA